ncbi:MAG: YabP/YqfC family sporulation protein [Ruminococcus sp.]|nr:YabP/YqfC family sporulation protein [Ruminococcus sp.]
MNRKKDTKRLNSIKNKIPPQFLSGLSHLELLGNRQITIEGSRGILKYSDDVIRINAGSMVISFSGRNLNVKCIAPDCTMVEGFVTKIEFTV